MMHNNNNSQSKEQSSLELQNVFNDSLISVQIANFNQKRTFPTKYNLISDNDENNQLYTPNNKLQEPSTTKSIVSSIFFSNLKKDLKISSLSKSPSTNYIEQILKESVSPITYADKFKTKMQKSKQPIVQPSISSSQNQLNNLGNITNIDLNRGRYCQSNQQGPGLQKNMSCKKIINAFEPNVTDFCENKPKTNQEILNYQKAGENTPSKKLTTSSQKIQQLTPQNNSSGLSSTKFKSGGGNAGGGGLSSINKFNKNYTQNNWHPQQQQDYIYSKMFKNSCQLQKIIYIQRFWRQYQINQKLITAYNPKQLKISCNYVEEENFFSKRKKSIDQQLINSTNKVSTLNLIIERLIIELRLSNKIISFLDNQNRLLIENDEMQKKECINKLHQKDQEQQKKVDQILKQYAEFIDKLIQDKKELSAKTEDICNQLNQYEQLLKEKEQTISNQALEIKENMEKRSDLILKTENLSKQIVQETEYKNECKGKINNLEIELKKKQFDIDSQKSQLENLQNKVVTLQKENGELVAKANQINDLLFAKVNYINIIENEKELIVQEKELTCKELKRIMDENLLLKKQHKEEIDQMKIEESKEFKFLETKIKETIEKKDDCIKKLNSYIEELTNTATQNNTSSKLTQSELSSSPKQ